MQHIKDLAAAVMKSATNEPDARIPASEQRKGRVIERATLAELDTSHPTMKAAVAMVRAWADRKTSGHQDASLVLVGPYGTGKTHIARAVLWSISYTVEDGTAIAPAGRFFHASDLMLKLAPTNTDWGGQQVVRPSEFIGNAPIVVIDDIGSEGVIPFIGVDSDKQAAERQARYFRVIDNCYQWNISLVITSNLSIAQLEQHLGGRCWDRLCEMAPKGFMFDLTGVPSWRQKVSGR
jgi:DNA replication protein DnaC